MNDKSISQNRTLLDISKYTSAGERKNFSQWDWFWDKISYEVGMPLAYEVLYARQEAAMMIEGDGIN